MIDKSVMVVMFMYAVSGSILAGQIVLADAFEITLTSFEGEPIESHLAGFINESELNERAENSINANFTANSTYYDKTETFTTAAAYVAWELITLLSGTYIFNVMYLMGIPIPFVIIFVTGYLFLLLRTIIGVVRGI